MAFFMAIQVRKPHGMIPSFQLRSEAELSSSPYSFVACRFYLYDFSLRQIGFEFFKKIICNGHGDFQFRNSPYRFGSGKFIAPIVRNNKP
jgi:hypothetical protein